MIFFDHQLLHSIINPTVKLILVMHQAGIHQISVQFLLNKVQSVSQILKKLLNTPLSLFFHCDVYIRPFEWHKYASRQWWIHGCFSFIWTNNAPTLAWRKGLCGLMNCRFSQTYLIVNVVWVLQSEMKNVTRINQTSNIFLNWTFNKLVTLTANKSPLTGSNWCFSNINDTVLVQALFLSLILLRHEILFSFSLAINLSRNFFDRKSWKEPILSKTVFEDFLRLGTR